MTIYIDYKEYALSNCRGHFGKGTIFTNKEIGSGKSIRRLVKETPISVKVGGPPQVNLNETLTT